MEINIEEVENKQEWETFLTRQEETPFFQSWLWGEVQIASGLPVYRLGIYVKQNLIGIAQVIHVKARRGHCFHVRHGPVLNEWKWEVFELFFKFLCDKAKKVGVIFIRVSPLLPDEEKVRKKFKELGFRDSPVHNMDGEIAWVLNLQDQTEEGLLSHMRKTTRYLIRKAIKMGVQIEAKNDRQALESFLKLYKETAVRQHFVPHRGVTEEFNIMGHAGQVKLFTATYQGKVYAASLVVYYGNQAVFHHSGTLVNEGVVPASYLLQWEAIREAKKMGLQRYNFWGIAPPEKKNHPWKGLTLFKTGFGGRLARYVHAQDWPLSPSYIKVYLMESFFRIRKGY